MRDVLIVGAGPIGIASGIAAKRRDLDAVLVEQGAMVNSLVNYPTDLEFFSTPDLLEIGGHPFPTRGPKPVRAEAIEYYTKVARRENLDVRLYERVEGVEGEQGDFSVRTEEGVHRARNVVVATGFFERANLMEVPGEELDKVVHYYKEPYPYIGQKVAVIGARNSAAKVALDCHRHGAEVTLIHRGPEISEKVKYWIKPDLENRIAEGSIDAYFDTDVRRIEEDAIYLEGPDGPFTLENDWVLAMTGYKPDLAFLEELGIELQDDEHRTPVFDEDTMETNREGIYLAGVICGGLQTHRLFIENSRIHARRIMHHIATGAPVAA